MGTKIDFLNIRASPVGVLNQVLNPKIGNMG